MRILHLDTGLAFGGGQQQVELTLRAQQAEPFEVALLAPPAAPLARRAAALAIPLFPWHPHGVGTLGTRTALRRAVAAWRPDLVHTHDARSLLLARLAALRVPVVASRRMDFAVTRRSARGLYCWAARVVAVSRAAAAPLLAAGVPAERIRIVPDGIDPARFLALPPREPARRRWGIAREEFHVGCLALLVPSKSPSLLLDAVAKAVKDAPRLRLTLGGEGPLRSSLEEQVRSLGLAERVRLPGFIDDPLPFFAALDLYAQPSAMEGLGTAAIEAMAAGLPVVASDAGGLPETVAGYGRLFPRGDADALAALLRSLAQDPAQRQAIAAACLRRSRDFDFHRQHLLLADVYRQVLTGGPPPPVA